MRLRIYISNYLNCQILNHDPISLRDGTSLRSGKAPCQDLNPDPFLPLTFSAETASLSIRLVLPSHL
jgi:hypothetical protein